MKPSHTAIFIALCLCACASHSPIPLSASRSAAEPASERVCASIPHHREQWSAPAHNLVARLRIEDRGLPAQSDKSHVYSIYIEFAGLQSSNIALDDIRDIKLQILDADGKELPSWRGTQYGGSWLSSMVRVHALIPRDSCLLYAYPNQAFYTPDDGGFVISNGDDFPHGVTPGQTLTLRGSAIVDIIKSGYADWPSEVPERRRPKTETIQLPPIKFTLPAE